MSYEQAVTPEDVPNLELERRERRLAVKTTAVVEETRTVEMFERLARDPSVDVEKLERLIAMQERIMRHNAKAAYESAFARMQPSLPEIAERGQILNKDRTTVRSTYAKLEDIHVAIKPILALHGFAVRHRTEWPADKPGIIRIVGILSHEQGHSEESVFEAPMDKSEYRTDIQSMGSTVSYGRRYTTLDLLNLATRGVDNDGAGKPLDAPKAPEGFEQWWEGMRDIAVEGLPKYTAMWRESKREYREYVNDHMREKHELLKTQAELATKGGRA